MITGPSAQLPTQFTVSRVKFLSGLAPRSSVLSRRFRSSTSRAAPRTWHAVPVQTFRSCLPFGVRVKARKKVATE